MSTHPIIALNDVSVVFPAKGESPEVTALKGINLTLEPNECVMIIGRSGCGKTTLLNLMAGFIAPTSGSALIHGVPITGPGVDRGVVFQKNALMPWLNVFENVALGLTFQGVPKAERAHRVHTCLQQVGLAEFADHRIYEISGGMRQRVGIARALAADPAILLMDEPLGALDALTRESIQELVLDLWQTSGKLIAFITHSIEEALFMGTRLIVMTPRPGRIHTVYPLEFSRRFLAERDARSIKSNPDFIALREEVLQIINPRSAQSDHA
ncbi:MAG: ATP-binding cassette domain-containing protein [Myxococcota bacterium]